MLIEGIGDEVLVLFAVVVIVFILTLAWVSTSVSDRPFVGIVVLDRRRFDNLIRRIRESGITLLGPDGRLAATVSSLRQRTNENEGDRSQAASSAETPSSQDRTESSASSQESTNRNNDETQNSATQNVDNSSSSGLSVAPESHENNENQPVHEGERRSSTSFSEVVGLSELRQRRVEHLEAGTTSVESSDSTGAGIDANVPSVGGDIPSPIISQESTTIQDNNPQGASLPVPNVTDSTPASSEVLDEGQINIKIKYLDDRQMQVRAHPEDTIGQFKRRFFGAELSENMIVRFIHNGQELRQDNSTLQSYNIGNNSVIHCLLSQARQNLPTEQQQGGIDLDMGTLMFPLFGLILALIWYCRFAYRVYFNTISTFALAGITFLFMIAAMASWRAPPNQEQIE